MSGGAPDPRCEPSHPCAVIARAPAPLGCAAPFPVETNWWPGTLLAWRWIDREWRTWTALVRYQRDGLMHEHR